MKNNFSNMRSSKKQVRVAPLQSVVLSEKKMQALLGQYQATGDEKILKRILNHMEETLQKEAHRYPTGRAIEAEDLMNVGRMVIYEHAKTYDVHSMVPFEEAVRGAIHDAMREEYNMYKNPFCASRRSEITTETVSIDSMFENEDGEVYENPEIMAAVQRMHALTIPDKIVDQIPGVLSTLTEQERQIVQKSFGIELDKEDDSTIAQQLGMTEARLRQVRARIERKIRFRLDVSEAGCSYHTMKYYGI